MVDVVLINAPISLPKDNFLTEGDERSNEPLGLLYLASNLEKNKHSVEVLDITPQGLSLEKQIQIIKKEKPLLVGISAMTPGIRSSVVIAQALRKEFGKKLSLCLGGPHLNSDPTFSDRFPFFDFSIVGEGEETLVEMVELIKRGKQVKGRMVGRLIMDLDSLPFPDRKLINLKNYFRKEESKGEITATLLGSRGCRFKCIFCSKAPHQRRVRFRSAKNIADEMEMLYKEGIRKFSFVDDTLTLNRKNTFELCREITQRRLKINWKAMTRANCVDDALLKAMAGAGCDDLFFGVESGNERIRNKIIKKQIRDEEIQKAVELCRWYNIHTNLFLMVGFPTETEKELMDTVRIGHKVKADLIGVRITVPLPGSEIFDYVIKNKIIAKNVIDDYARGKLGEGFVGHWPLFVPKGLTLNDLVEFKRRIYRRFYLTPKFIFRRLGFYLKNPHRIKEDLGLFKIGPGVLLKGKSPGSMS